MSSAGRAVSSSGCVTKPKERAIGLTGRAVSIRSSSLTGSYVMETAEHREPYESRGSRTVLGAPGGEIPPGDSTPKIPPLPESFQHYRRQLGAQVYGAMGIALAGLPDNAARGLAGDRRPRTAGAPPGNGGRLPCLDRG